MLLHHLYESSGYHLIEVDPRHVPSARQNSIPAGIDITIFKTPGGDIALVSWLQSRHDDEYMMYPFTCGLHSPYVRGGGKHSKVTQMTLGSRVPTSPPASWTRCGTNRLTPIARFPYMHAGFINRWRFFVSDGHWPTRVTVVILHGDWNEPWQ